MPVVKKVYEVFHNSYTNINDISDVEIWPIITKSEYQTGWKPETRCKAIRKKGQQYYQTMFMAGSKIIVSQTVYNKAFACVTALKESPATSMYFKDNDPFKTSSHREYEFPESFLKWRYDIQARLYWRLIRQALDKDPYFWDFQLMEYRFIVVNNIDNPVPLVWKFRHTQTLGEIELGGKKLRDPERIGEELSYYLKCHPAVPLGIATKNPNSIEQWFENR